MGGYIESVNGGQGLVESKLQRYVFLVGLEEILHELIGLVLGMVLAFCLLLLTTAACNSATLLMSSLRSLRAVSSSFSSLQLYYLPCLLSESCLLSEGLNGMY